MLQRMAARVVTGPLAFLLGGVLDVLAYAGAAWRTRLARTLRRPSTIPRRDEEL